jgi:hypothetical protein
MQEKVDPYLRPMYDALADLMSYDKMRRYIELGVIEIAPLAFMRGRTLHNSFVILDEAQNTTVRQMKMFLTRMGVNSRAVITGDITQIDLKDPQPRAWCASRASSARCRTSSSSTSIPRTWCGTAWCATSSARSTTITRGRTARRGRRRHEPRPDASHARTRAEWRTTGTATVERGRTVRRL